MEEGLDMARRLCDQALIAEVLANLSQYAEFMGDRAEAVRCAEEALEIGRILGDDRLIGTAVGFLGFAVSTSQAKKQLCSRRWPPACSSRGCCRVLLVAHPPRCHRAGR